MLERDLILSNINSYIAKHSSNLSYFDLLLVVLIYGKSTLIGRLLYESNMIYDRAPLILVIKRIIWKFGKHLLRVMGQDGALSR